MANFHPLGERVRRARERRSLSLYELSKKSGVNRWVLKRIEDGLANSRKISVETATLLIRELYPDLDLHHFVNECDIVARRKRA